MVDTKDEGDATGIRRCGDFLERKSPHLPSSPVSPVASFRLNPCKKEDHPLGMYLFLLGKSLIFFA